VRARADEDGIGFIHSCIDQVVDLKAGEATRRAGGNFSVGVEMHLS
jgi:hypothetical protein